MFILVVARTRNKRRFPKDLKNFKETGTFLLKGASNIYEKAHLPARFTYRQGKSKTSFRKDRGIYK